MVPRVMYDSYTSTVGQYGTYPERSTAPELH